MKTISIGKDFSRAPIGRYESDGPYNGAKFRDKLLKPALDTGELVKIIIDDAEGYGSSFLEEAFGGLIRVHHYKKKELLKQIQIEYSLPEFKIYDKLITKYVKEAQCT